MIKPRCLIVEDSPIDAQFIVDMLERRCGLPVEWQRVTSAEEFTEALKSADWDVILSDWLMPGFGAKKAWDIYKKSGVGIPFIIVSGLANDEDLAPLLQDGAHGFSPKNRVGLLGALIKRYLNKADNALGDMAKMMVMF